MRTLMTGLFAVVLLGAAPVVASDIVFDFEDGNQGWGAFGPLTTDSGLTTGSVGQGRYHSADFDLAGWGIVDVSPGTTMAGYTGMTIDARLAGVAGFPPFVGTPELRFGLGLGGAEWFLDYPLTDQFQTFAANFADLVPSGTATAPISAAELADPGLQIKLVVYNAENSGTGVLYYDQVTAIPEPASLALLAMGGLALIRRR